MPIVASLPSFGDNGESYFACLQVNYCVRGFPLGEDGLLFWKEDSLPALADGVKECIGVKLPVTLGS